jgi:PTS system nitrogen regulatory IIA component
VKLQKLIDAEHVLLDLDASSTEEALAVVARRVADEVGVDADVVSEALLERERLGSTSVGGGFAIPHCKLSGITSIWVALARFTGGLEFSAADGRPVSFLFVVLSPPDQPAAHLQVLSQIARVLKRQDLRERLRQADTVTGVLEALDEVARLEGL